MNKFKLSLSIVFFFFSSIFAQSYNWPCIPSEEQHLINGTFCENRIGSLGDRDHFHDGVDIHLSQGGSVFSVTNGRIDGVGGVGTINAWIRVGNYAYVHVDFNPALGIGDPVVAFETIIGTTNSWNHIHFKDGMPGSEINALRNGGGLDPFIDNFQPTIDYIQFYINGTTRLFPDGRVYGPVEIVAKARDKTDNGTYGNNNGIYAIGYQIYDSSGTVPLSDPVINFQFDQIPASDNYIFNVYFPGTDQSTYIYSITNRINGDGYWNADLLEKGTYQVKVFTQDTRQNTAENWRTVEIVAPDNSPPATPELSSLTGDDSNQWELRWMPNDSLDVAGYDLSYTLDGIYWTRHTNISNDLTPQDTQYVFSSYPNNSLTYFRLNAYDNAAFPNLSDSSDAYGFQLSPDGPQILIIDGFDRTTGYWPQSSHTFVMKYGKILSELDLAFNTCSDDAIRTGRVSLNDYPIIIYLLGDELGDKKVISSEEQFALRDYLINGGKLIISGSEIGSDLNTSGVTDDEEFYQNYLKAVFIADSANSRDLTGAAGTVFEGFTTRITPPQDMIYKSDIIQANNSDPLLYFTDGNCAGIYYSGFFGTSLIYGRLAHFSFPIELIADYNDRKGLIGRILGLFGVVSSISKKYSGNNPVEYALYQNFPNPFNPSTVIGWQLAVESQVELSIYTISGEKVATLVSERQKAGRHQVEWDVSRHGRIASGIYYYQIRTDEFQDVKKMILLR